MPGSGASSYGLYDQVTNGIQTTSTGSITILSDTFSLSGANNINSATGVTLAPYTPGNSVSVYGTQGTVQYTSGLLADITGTSYTFGSTSDSNTMTVNGNTWTTPVSFISGSSGSILVSAAQSGSGAFTFTGPTTLSAGVASTGSGSAILFNNAVTLGASDTVSSTNGNITFSSTVDGTSSGVQSLTVNSGTGTTTFTGKVGNGTPLNNLTVTADSLTLGNNVFGTGTLTIRLPPPAPTSTSMTARRAACTSPRRTGIHSE